MAPATHALVLALCAVAAGACNRDRERQHPTQTATAEGAPAARRSSGCGSPAGDLSPRSVTLRVGAAERTYFLSLPQTYDANTPYPLVVGFHGSSSSGARFRNHLALEELAHGSAIFVYPDGLDVGGGSGWHLKSNGRDVALFDAVLKDVEAGYCVDEKSLFAVGFSYGGYMVNALGCARADVLRGIASIAGGGPEGQCNGGVAALLIHGSNDFNEPFTSSEASRDRWLEANRCRKDTTPVAAAPGCVSYAGCARSTPLQFCRHEGGHDIPHEARSVIWSFFAGLR